MTDKSCRTVLIAHNLRSCHNVGSLFRTAEGLGINKLYLTGYTPYPKHLNDKRLPHIALKTHKQINKTSLDAENYLDWEFAEDINAVIIQLKQQNYIVTALEQAQSSIDIVDWLPPKKTAIIVGRETYGIEPDIFELCDMAVEIPMKGIKESFNVVQAAAMALFYCTFMNNRLQ